MAEMLTPQQEQAVTNRGGKLLVSAAAGSGKTKVLVDRLMLYLTDPSNPANIDDFLIITYTKAAAAELRGKIAAKLSQRIAEHPENRHLQQQMHRLYLTKISTVHAFCTDLLRENAYRLDIPGDFRVAEENEAIELQMLAIAQVLEDAYQNIDADPDFQALVDTQGLGRDDRQIPEIVLKVYSNARCHLDPDKWLEWCFQVNDISSVQDASEMVWGKYLIDDLHQYLDLQIHGLSKCLKLASSADAMDKPVALLSDIVSQLEQLRSCGKWDDIIRHMHIDYGRLVFSKKCTDLELAEQIKAVRDSCKKGLSKKLRRFSDNSERIIQDIQNLTPSVRGLVHLVNNFSDTYSKIKCSRHVLDFSDLEHITLNLLWGKSRTAPTAIANEVGQRFREVMVDEYQDTNEVQDAIFEALTRKRQNCFMVGDVKQSIYQFRLADPGIFLEKYNAYVPSETAAPGQGRKVLLSHNFRSSRAVIDAVNDVFGDCMSQSVGGLSYGEDEALREGIPHETADEPQVELYGVCVNEDTYAEEASFVAHRITQLLDGTHLIRDKEGQRAICPEDIVILLRSPGSVGAAYANALAQQGIRCSFGGSIDILQTEEVQTLRSILQIVDNPLQDIPLVAALTSRVFGFTADELAQIRGEDRGGTIYQTLQKSQQQKVIDFVSTLSLLRNESRMKDVSATIQFVIATTKLDQIFAAATDGDIREENLQTFCQIASGFDAGASKTLGHFLRHLDTLESKGLPSAAQQSVAGAVSIMSIHKSKGLEFPVVFLCGLSREFNRDSVYAQVLCDKELGLGLSCVDTTNRVRYPSVAKRAIAAKMTAQSISEELRVLYVAMTRPMDRLIMTYASNKIDDVVSGMVNKMDVCNNLQLTSDVDCPGKWVLYSALKRQEAGELFQFARRPEDLRLSENSWLIRVVKAPEGGMCCVSSTEDTQKIGDDVLKKMGRALAFQYAHLPATVMPSKLTATQLKGRDKDFEVAENTGKNTVRKWRKPSFVSASATAMDYGNAMHTVMQYIDFKACVGIQGVKDEILRLVDQQFISQEQGDMVNPQAIADFFTTDLGQRICQSDNVLREFKFSVLDDCGRYRNDVKGEMVLLQGIVDCALIEPDGITVVDFKTDRAKQADISDLAAKYRHQVMAYANALTRIFNMPVKEKYLYFFAYGQLVDI